MPDRHKSRRREAFFNTSFPSVSHDLQSRVAAFATRTGLAVSAGITAGARRSRRLQGLAPDTAGRVSHAESLPHNTDEASSLA